jgi:hypothetical protein
MRRAAVVLACILTAAPTHLQSGDQKIAVTVYVNCADSVFMQRTQSYLERELRDLHDVEISPNILTSDFALRILAHNTIVDGKNVWALAYSYTFYQTCGTESYVVLVDGGLGFVQTFDQLKALSATIVAEMDQKALKSYRQTNFNSKRAK